MGRGDLFCSSIRSAYTLNHADDETGAPYYGGRILTVQALTTRMRLRMLEVSCVSNCAVSLRRSTIRVWQGEGETAASNAVAATICNLNGEAAAVSKCEAWRPYSDGSNYGGNADAVFLLNAQIMARLPMIWKFQPEEHRIAKGQVVLVRLSPTTDLDIADVTLTWEELD